MARHEISRLIAAALLTVATTRHHAVSALDESGTESEPMIALTRPELLRLLRTFALPQPVTAPEHVLHWSRW
ncbi:IS701 family transposase, partial [Streptomyces phaeochromogenes]